MVEKVRHIYHGTIVKYKQFYKLPIFVEYFPLQFYYSKHGGNERKWKSEATKFEKNSTEYLMHLSLFVSLSPYLSKYLSSLFVCLSVCLSLSPSLSQASHSLFFSVYTFAFSLFSLLLFVSLVECVFLSLSLFVFIFL